MSNDKAVLERYKKMRLAFLLCFFVWLVTLGASIFSLAVFFLSVLGMNLFPIPYFIMAVATVVTGVVAGVLSFYVVQLWAFVKSKGQYLYKTSRGFAFTFGEEKDMKMCEKLAVEGYSLIEVTKMGDYKFERCKPEECVYSVDYTEKELGAEKLQEYIAIFESGGWKHVCGWGIVHWFRAPKGTTPIYTDNTSLALKYKRMRRNTLLGIAIWGILAIIPAGLLILENSPVGRLFLIIILGTLIFTMLLSGVAAISNHRRVLRLRDRR